MNKNSKGSLGSGCFLIIFAAAFWGIGLLIYPKLPDYDEVMEKGQVVPGEVIKVETIKNVTINDKNPRKVHFRYGDGKKSSMTLAFGEKASPEKAIKVRVLGDLAYPEDLKPLTRPGWVKLLIIGLIVLGSLLFLGGFLRLLLMGGALVVAGHTFFKERRNKQPPPRNGPPAGPGPPPRNGPNAGSGPPPRNGPNAGSGPPPRTSPNAGSGPPPRTSPNAGSGPPPRP